MTEIVDIAEYRKKKARRLKIRHAELSSIAEQYSYYLNYLTNHSSSIEGDRQ